MKENLTPMMQQYMDIKEKHRDCILFFRLGDFYEMFFEDATVASSELEITLTGRDCGLEERAPMCGVPFHSAGPYIKKLIERGYKVALCEQVEDPALAKGIVKREVTRIVTPGTVMESTMLDEKSNNYLMCIYESKVFYGLSGVDVSTGEFFTTRIIMGNTFSKVLDEIAKYKPSEIIVNGSLYGDKDKISQLVSRFGSHISNPRETYFQRETAEEITGEFFPGESLEELCVNASGALLSYITETQKMDLSHINTIDIYTAEQYMSLDHATRRHLELTETMRDKTRRGSLLWVLDRTVTSMGGRVLKRWLEEPLMDVEDINGRLDGVEEFKEKYMVRMEIREVLKRVYDMERLIGRIVTGSANARDLTALKLSLAHIPHIKGILGGLTSDINRKNHDVMDELDDIYELIEKSIEDDPPITIREGQIIKSEYNEELHELRNASSEGRKWIGDLEIKEREKTGIKNLKVGFNKVFGYYIEVTRSYYHLVPDGYIRKQTLANCERYIIEDLKTIEDKILNSQAKAVELEYELFQEIRLEIATSVDRIKRTGQCIATIDVLSSLAELADRENFTRPHMTSDMRISITDGRHPVVEKMISQENFVPNGSLIDGEDNRVLIITGPNMAGKSTYMRQVALIVLMAQMGSYVPAAQAEIGICDRIFTRVGASDDLSSGQSTFMVEMNEVSNILDNATSRSLLILDEVGRGTSTFDGLSIAWAVIEYIADMGTIGSRTLFSTHYHELTELEDKIEGIKNYRITVEEKGEDIVFLRKIVPGGADESYGIQVARLAGLPQRVIDRAYELIKNLEAASITEKSARRKRHTPPLENQINLFAYDGFSRKYDELVKTIREINLSEITPLEAMNRLYEIQQYVQRE